MKYRIIEKQKGNEVDYYIQRKRFKVWLYCFNGDLYGTLFFLILALISFDLLFVNIGFIALMVIFVVLSIILLENVEIIKFKNIKDANQFIINKEKPKQKIIKSTKIHYTAKDLRKSKLNKINGR